MAVDWDVLVLAPTVGIFGDRVRYSTRLGSFEVYGVFDEAYLELTPLGRGGPDTETFALGSPGAITTETPVLGIRLKEFQTPPRQSDVLEMLSGSHSGERFEVKEVRTDGHGGAKLLLNEYRR